MGEESGLTLRKLARRLETLERENAELRHKVAALEGLRTTRRGEEVASEPFEVEGRVSRRQLLSKAGVAAAGLVVAGALTQRDIREASAASPPEAFLSATGTPAVTGTNTGGGTGVKGDSTNGFGVQGSGPTGVYGSSSESDHSGVYGQHTGSSGYGIIGDGKGLGTAGVLGRNQVGVGVFGTGAEGYGGQFEGGKAQLRLVPKSSAGSPTSGNHTKGEIYMDSAGALFVCTRSGNPGRWRKVTTTAV